MLGVASALVSPLAGELVYNGTHGDTCYYVNCSLGCTLEFFNWSCPSTPSPTPSPSTPTTHERSTSSTPPSRVPGCPDLDPPRQVCVCGGFCPLWHLNPTCCLPVGHAPASVPHTSPSGQGFRQPAGRRVCGGRPAFSPWLAALLDRVALGFQPPGQGLASMAQPSRVGQAGRAHPASQCSCLENPRDRGAWWAAVYGVAQSQTRLKRLSSSQRSPASSVLAREGAGCGSVGDVPGAWLASAPNNHLNVT